ncbi:hypothetical protein H8K35_03875 [Undibacterium sp. LX40W]|uniref:Uncharacterized protein n=1 Tax=Undibacterium nitidum TaxID=2762298 RepID=A0A923KSN5_9BURK|nr:MULTISPECIES: hypothetical protein [Undibacterium]MBC3880472.1 hypothetical protein [Undibacterium nitidum]MBC3890792.1 hypothetical protein [Undibacterium sp. LX40W]
MEQDKYSKKDRADAKTYSKELRLSIVLYVIVLFASIFVAKSLEAGALQTAVVLTPVLPGLLTMRAIIRHLNRQDEFMRIYMLEMIAIAGGVTAFLSFSYGFAEGVGFPKLNGFVHYGVFMATWLVVVIIRKFQER